MSEWISVEDRLPPEDQPVLCWCNDGDTEACEVASHHNSFFIDWSHELLPVTHWMPLPEPPEVAS
ncbi:hypothetical protein D3C78_1522080 [compost metagenome]